MKGQPFLKLELVIPLKVIAMESNQQEQKQELKDNKISNTANIK